MGQHGKIWKRKGRPGWYATIDGKQVALGEDQKEAQREFYRLKGQSERPTPGRLSVLRLVHLFLDDCKPRLSPHTYRRYRIILQSWVDHCGRARASDLRVLDITRWIDRRRKDWNSSTQAKAIAIVKTWSAWSEREGHLDADKLCKARSPKSLKRQHADPRDLDAIERAIECPYFRDYWHCLKDTGCRPGELDSLEAATIDLRGSTAVVSGKTGPRTIGLSRRAVGILRRYAKLYPSGPVLRRSDGLPWTEARRGTAFGKVRRKANLPRVITQYHLRHDLYRRWHAAGISDVVVAGQLGHQKGGAPHIDLLVSTYSHVTPKELAKAARA